MMRYDICHTLVLDKDRKFVNVFTEVFDLLQLNWHLLPVQNHNSMLIESINRNLDKGIWLICNERDSIRVTLEAI